MSPIIRNGAIVAMGNRHYGSGAPGPVDVVFACIMLALVLYLVCSFNPWKKIHEYFTDGSKHDGCDYLSKRHKILAPDICPKCGVRVGEKNWKGTRVKVESYLGRDDKITEFPEAEQHGPKA